MSVINFQLEMEGLFSVQRPVTEEPLAGRTFSSPFIFALLSKINRLPLFLDSILLNWSLSVLLPAEHCLDCCGLQNWVRGSGSLSSVLFQNHFYDSSNFSFRVNFQTCLSVAKESCQGLIRASLLSADEFPQRWQADLTFWSTQRYWTLCAGLLHHAMIFNTHVLSSILWYKHLHISFLWSGWKDM